MLSNLHEFSHLIQLFGIEAIITPILHEEIEALEHSVISPKSLSWLVVES